MGHVLCGLRLTKLSQMLSQATDEYDANTQSDYNSGLSLRKAGYTIFLVVVVVLFSLVLIGPVTSQALRGAPKPCLLVETHGLPYHCFLPVPLEAHTSTSSLDRCLRARLKC